MPVAGLPAAAETTLNALLADNIVTSWKVAGEGDSTVVVLRLRPDSTVNTPTNMAGRPQTAAVHYKRKPPSQLNRDAERSKRWRERREGFATEASDYHAVDNVCPLFLSTPELIETSESNQDRPSRVPVTSSGALRVPSASSTGFTDCRRPDQEDSVCHRERVSRPVDLLD